MQFHIKLMLFYSISINSVLNICDSVTHRAFISPKYRNLVDFFDDHNIGREICVEGKLYTQSLDDTDSE